MKTMERRKSQLIKYKMVNYQVKEGVDKNEEEVEKGRAANQIQDGKVSDKSKSEQE